MKKLIAVLSFILLNAGAFAQITSNEKPYIEVNGYAEREVVPDDIYITITIMERYDGRNKITIAEQEQQLRDIIKNLGIDMSSLSLSNADASYVRVNWFNKDVIAKKIYSLKVHSADMTGKVFQALAEINIKNAVVSKVDFKDKETLKKELRIAAIKNAKEQAGYMLEAIGQSVGKPLSINDNTNNFIPYMNVAMAKMNNNSNEQEDAVVNDNDYIEFKKIKFSSTVNAKFEIK